MAKLGERVAAGTAAPSQFTENILRYSFSHYRRCRKQNGKMEEI
jgi:hypothetical protein